MQLDLFAPKTAATPVAVVSPETRPAQEPAHATESGIIWYSAGERCAYVVHPAPCNYVYLLFGSKLPTLFGKEGLPPTMGLRRVTPEELAANKSSSAIKIGPTGWVQVQGGGWCNMHLACPHGCRAATS